MAKLRLHLLIVLIVFVAAESIINSDHSDFIDAREGASTTANDLIISRPFNIFSCFNFANSCSFFFRPCQCLGLFESQNQQIALQNGFSVP